MMQRKSASGDKQNYVTNMKRTIFLFCVLLGANCALPTEDTCARFLEIVAEHKIELTEKLAPTFEFCESLLEDDSEALPDEADDFGVQKNFRRRDSRQRRVRRDDCRIEFFERSHFIGPSIALRESVGLAMVAERSVRTFGRCCWKVFARPNYSGPHRVLEGDGEYQVVAEYGWRPEMIRSVRKLRPCTVRRRN